MSHLHERMCGVVGTEYSILWALSRFFGAGRGGCDPRVLGEGLSEAGFTGLLGIFRIAGDRLLPDLADPFYSRVRGQIAEGR